MTEPTAPQHLSTGIQRHLRESLGRAEPNIINEKNDLFPKKKNALNQQLWHLRKIGIGVTKNELQ